MISWLTYGVFLITTLLAILAIVDKTWAKDRPDLANGLRWVLFVLILLMFVANVVKDVLVDSRDQKAQQKRQEEQEQLVKIIKDQSSQIKTLSQQLNDANLTISDTRTKLLDAQLSSEKISEAIQAYVYDRLSGSTNRFVGDLGIMLAHASDGWLPRNKQEFFSKRSVDLICRWLNADGAAQVIPDRPWYVRFNEVSKEYEAVLVNSLNAYASRLPPSLIRSASAVADRKSVV